MVGCDNPACLVEWYHFGCVQLTEEVRSSGLPWFTVSFTTEMLLASFCLAGGSVGMPGM
jgi:hypothetical protein